MAVTHAPVFSLGGHEGEKKGKAGLLWSPGIEGPKLSEISTQKMFPVVIFFVFLLPTIMLLDFKI